LKIWWKIIYFFLKILWPRWRKMLWKFTYFSHENEWISSSEIWEFLGFLKMIEFNLKSRAALKCARRYIIYLLTRKNKFTLYCPRTSFSIRCRLHASFKFTFVTAFSPVEKQSIKKRTKQKKGRTKENNKGEKKSSILYRRRSRYRYAATHKIYWIIFRSCNSSLYPLWTVRIEIFEYL